MTGLAGSGDIQEPGLLCEVLRLGLIERRAAGNVNAFRFEAIEGILDVPLAIAKV
jgi:hypothetical protein